MRINKYIALAKGIGRRQADKLIANDSVKVNGLKPDLNHQVSHNDKITLNDQTLQLPKAKTTIILNKPVGYVVSRQGQGSKTIYTLLPKDYQQLKPVGRLDKDSSGLLLLSNDGQLNHQLSHPSFNKQKMYLVTLDKALNDSFIQKLNKGVKVEDYISKLGIQKVSDKKIIVSMTEGKNRQIRRTFETLGYRVVSLHRTNFGDFKLGNLKPGEYQEVSVS